MPTRDVVLTDHQAAEIERLRQAARIGMADIDAGRFHAFADAESLGQHLATLADEAIARVNGPGTRQP